MRTFFCKDCGKEMSVENDRGPLPIRCPDCARTHFLEYKRKASRERHAKLLAARVMDKCAKCGCEFQVKGDGHNRARPDLCPDCARSIPHVSVLAEQYTLVKNADIRTAKERPPGVSAVRWRIELRRRENPGFYDAFGEDVR